MSRLQRHFLLIVSSVISLVAGCILGFLASSAVQPQSIIAGGGPKPKTPIVKPKTSNQKIDSDKLNPEHSTHSKELSFSQGSGYGLQATAESQSDTIYQKKLASLKTHYQGDTYALSKIAFAESEVQKNLKDSLSKELEMLEASMKHLNKTKRDVLLLEMRLKTRHGQIISGMAGRRIEGIKELKFGMDLIGDAVPPLYRNREDRHWKRTLNVLHLEASTSYFSRVRKEELSGVSVSELAYEQNKHMWGNKLPGLILMNPHLANGYKDTLKWLRIFKKLVRSDKQKKEIRQTIENLEDWYLKHSISAKPMYPRPKYAQPPQSPRQFKTMSPLKNQNIKTNLKTPDM